MKTILSVVVAAAVFVAPALAASAEPIKTYTDPVFLYSIDYPDTWKLKHAGKYAVLASPFQSKEDRFAENVSIVAEDLSQAPTEITLIDYYRQSVGDAPRRLQDFKILEEAQTVWNGHNSVANLYTMTSKGEPFKCKTYTFMEGKMAYVLIYTGRAADFDAYLAEAERIMRSIQVSP